MRQKVRLDVERLLSWAYREELPKGYVEPLGGSSGTSPMFRLAALGGPVDNWEREPGFPAAACLGPPHGDACLVDTVLQGLPSVGIEWARSRPRIMGHLAPYVSPNHPALSHLSFELGPLLMTHARMGTRPKWDLGPITLNRILGKNNKPRVQYLDEHGEVVEGLTAGRRYGPMARCPLALDPDGADIAFARLEYFAWRQGLVAVKARLLDWGLSEHEPTGPAAAAEPWIVDDEPKSRVLRGR